MASNPPNYPPAPGDGNAPFDPTNVNDPRYDRSRDPRYDPRWQRQQQRFFRDQQRAQSNQDRAAQRAQAAVWKAQARAQRDQWKMYLRSQRRTSLIGPILLIAVGVVFFLVHTGRIAPIGFFVWYGRWWPLLLIAIGLLRLAEWVIDRARQPAGAPALQYTVGGGAVFAVVVLSCLGLALHAGGQWHADRNGMGLLMPDWTHGDMNHFFGEKHEEDAPLVVRAIAAGGSLSIDNPHGDVTVAGTSDDGKVHLSVHKEVYANSDSAAFTRLRELTATLDGSGDSLSLRVPAIESAGADLTLLVPNTTRLVLNSDHGDVHVNNLKSPLSVTANNGDVEIAAITSTVQVRVNNRKRDVNVRSVTGDVSVNGNGDEVTMSDITGAATVRGDFYGGGHLQRVSGSVEYHSSRSDISLAHLNGELQLDGHDLTASEVVGPMLVNTRSRNISLDKVTGDVKVVNNHGDVDIHVAPPTGAVTVDNQNGNVNLSLPERARFTLTAETSDGDTHSDFDGSTRGDRGTLSGAVNGGGAAVRLNTSHGDINVNRNSIAPLPPAPPKPPRISGGSTTGFRVMDKDQTRQLEQMQRDAMATAAAALHESAEGARQSMRTSADQARERARQAKQEAQEAMQAARDKQREAERLAKEAAHTHDLP